jgi:nucleoside-diphosphate-sugar epimerase
VSPLRVLFIGGSGIISSACCRLAVQRGLNLYALNRGATQLRPLPAEVKTLHGDIRDQASARQALGDHEFDVVVNWIAFTPGHIETDLKLFRGRVGQYVFISSASAYQTPPSRVPVTESTPSTTLTGSTPATRSLVRIGWYARTARKVSPPRSSGHRTPTTAPLCRPMPDGRWYSACGKARRSSYTAMAPRCGR